MSSAWGPPPAGFKLPKPDRPLPDTLKPAPKTSEGPKCCQQCLKDLAEDPSLKCVFGLGRSVCMRCMRLSAVCLPIDPVCFVAAQNILDQAPAVAAMPDNDDKRAAWVRKVLFLRKFMEKRERERPDELEDVPAIRRQLTRIANSLESLEHVARWLWSRETA